MFQLRIVRRGQPPQIVEVLSDVALVGRSSDCDIVVDEKFVSGRHALIVGGLVVVDLESSNGTYVDGVRVDRATLLDGGRICLGHRDVTLEVLADPGSGDDSHAELLQRELRALRRTNRELEDELDELRLQAAQRATFDEPGPDASGRMARLMAENARLKIQLAELGERAGTESRG